jgi:hypothetical protein
VVDDLLRAALDLGVAALHRVKVQLAALAPVAMELAALPPMPMRMPGPPSWISRLPAGNSILWVCAASITPRPPAIMMGLW